MKKQGIIILATEEAKKNYKAKPKVIKDGNCPSCEIKTYVQEKKVENTFDIKEKNTK